MRRITPLIVLAGLPGVERAAEPDPCQRDTWAQNVVLSVQAVDLGATQTASVLCRAADRMVEQTAASLGAATLPRVKLANASLTRLQMCRDPARRPARHLPGSPTTVGEHYDGRFCRAENTQYVFGVEPVLRKAAAKPLRTSTAGGDRLAFFDVGGGSVGCDLTSIQKPTSDPATVGAIDLYLLARSGPLRGQRLCTALTGLAVTALGRLGLR